MTTYLIFEFLPSRSYDHRDPIPRPANPTWAVGVYERVGETPQRVLVKHVGGEDYFTKKDSQGRAYIEKADHRRSLDGGRIRETTDVEAALAYREKVRSLWADACAARDTIASPLFAEIAALQARIKDADAVCDAQLASIRAAGRRPVAEAAPSPPVAVEETVEPASESPTPIQAAPPISATGDPQQQLCLI